MDLTENNKELAKILHKITELETMLRERDLLIIEL